MIIEDQDMSDRLATYGYKSRPDREASLLTSRCDIRQSVGSNHHHFFLKHSKVDISQNVKFLSTDCGSLTVYLESSSAHSYTSAFVELSHGEDKAAERVTRTARRSFSEI